MMFGYWDHMSAWAWIGMSIGMAAFWAMVLAVVVLLVRSLGRDDRVAAPIPPAPPGPEQLLAERFARGEIGADEYQARLATLREKAPS